MPYQSVPSTAVEKLLANYSRLKSSLGEQTDGGIAVGGQMSEVADKIRVKLATDVGKISRYFVEHEKTVNDALLKAQKSLKDATTLSARYKKNPAQADLLRQVEQAGVTAGGLSRDAQRDSTDFGQAWFGYRGLDLDSLPAPVRTAFHAERSTIMNKQKVLGVKIEQLDRIKEQVDALLAVTDKATMKRDIKTGAGEQRDIAVARKDALALKSDMQSALAVLKDPKDTNPKPRNIELAASNLTTYVSQKKAAITRPIATAAQGTWHNADAAYKLMSTSTASMEKVLATKLKGFRSAELKDVKVNESVIAAQKLVKEAKLEVKKYDSAYAKAKKAWTQLEPLFRKAGLFEK